MQASIRNLSEAVLHPDYRWDSEYLCFQPYKNPNITYMPIGEILLSTQYGLSVAMNESGNGTKIYRMNEISNMMCNRNTLKYAPISSDAVTSYVLNDKDVLFNRTNSQAFVGRTGIFRKFSDEHMVFASYLVRVVPDSNKVTPEYLTAFLNTKHGILDVKRRARISINQSNVNAEELKRVEIPLVSLDLQLQITSAFNESFNLIQTSESKVEEAQTLLLTELGLTDWKPKHRLWFTKHYSDVRQTGRIDAEYYQPKYEQIINAIKGYAGGWDTLGNLVYLKDKNFKPEDKTEYRYIELAKIASNGEITGCITEEGQDLPGRARRKVVIGDVIVSSIEGSLDNIALIDEKYDGALCSTGFHVINSDVLNSEILLVLLKSIIGQLQLKKGCSGTILTAINKDELAQVVLPIIAIKKQTRIQQKVTESFVLRKQSKHLLECAKRAVEMAIEQDEKTAIDWLNEQVNSKIPADYSSKEQIEK